AELKQHGRAHQQSEGNERRRANVAARLIEDIALHDVPPGAAPFRRPGGRDPALGREHLVPAQQVVPGQVLVASNLVTQVRWEVIREPRAYLIAEGELFFGIIEIHDDTKAGSSS